MPVKHVFHHCIVLAMLCGEGLGGVEPQLYADTPKSASSCSQQAARRTTAFILDRKLILPLILQSEFYEALIRMKTQIVSDIGDMWCVMLDVGASGEGEGEGGREGVY